MTLKTERHQYSLNQPEKSTLSQRSALVAFLGLLALAPHQGVAQSGFALKEIAIGKTPDSLSHLYASCEPIPPRGKQCVNYMETDGLVEGHHYSKLVITAEYTIARAEVGEAVFFFYENRLVRAVLNFDSFSVHRRTDGEVERGQPHRGVQVLKAIKSKYGPPDEEADNGILIWRRTGSPNEELEVHKDFFDTWVFLTDKHALQAMWSEHYASDM